MPKFYLRGFAENDRIAAVQLPGHRRFVQSVGDATVVNNFYTVEGHEDGDDTIEKALSGVEGATAAVFKTIREGTWPLSANDRMVLGYFLALQAMRVPAIRRTADHVARQMLRLQVGAGGKSGLRRRLERQTGGEVADEVVERLWEQATRPEGPPIQRAKVDHIQDMLDHASGILKYIVGRPWSLVQFERRALITSDAPIALVGDPDEDPWRGVGYESAWGITFPLTRRLGLLMSDITPLIEANFPVEKVHQGAADMVQPATAKLEKFFNYHTVANASEWLFHHPEDERFVPEELPEPSPVNISVMGMDREFDGEPWFGPATHIPQESDDSL
ncbi:DUF4238 domain-containing protein [Sinomonas sp. B1-1]|uniref:DUF4238 domain-containing protein n=1 Tax=Sinomonas sp. B1-1 TaxID=3141454 RepID=UPI003D281049